MNKMKKQLPCTVIARGLLQKGLSFQVVLKKIQKINPNWKMRYVEEENKKLKNQKFQSSFRVFTKNPVNKHKEKVCQYPECNKKYVGHPISKFCPIHSNIKNRHFKIKDKLEDNKYIYHEFDDLIDLSLKCELCSTSFDIQIIPKQYIYPKYCVEHRNKFKRENYLKLNK